MSAARCIKLLHMLGLHKLDDPNAQFELAPTILPPKDWTELEGSYDFLALFLCHVQPTSDESTALIPL